MSPTIATRRPDFGFPKPDCPPAQNFKFSESSDFSAGSTDGGFNYSRPGTGKLNISSRFRPRLTKIRRKPMVVSEYGKSVKTDLGLNGFNDVSGEIKLDGEFGNVFRGNDGNSRSSRSANNGDLNGNKEQQNGSGFGVNLNDSVLGLGMRNGKSSFGFSTNVSLNHLQSKEAGFLFASDNGGSNLGVKKETGIFVFASDNGGPDLDEQKGTGSPVLGTHDAVSTATQNFPAQGSVFGPSKSGLQANTSLASGPFVFGVSDFNGKDSRGFNTRSKIRGFRKSVNIDFVFGSDKYDSASRETLNQQGPRKSCLSSIVDEFLKVNHAEFVFGASKNVSAAINSDTQKQDSGVNMDKSGSNKDAGKIVPDLRGKVKLDTSGDSEKVGNTCFQFSSNWSDSSGKNHLNFVFDSNSNYSKVGIGKPTGKSEMSNSTDSSKENVDVGIQFQNACIDGVFVFGGLKGKGGFSSLGSTKLVNEMKQSNRGKAEDCNGFGQHNHSTPHVNSNYRHSSSSGGFSDKGSAFSLLDEMRRLNISASGVDTKKAESSTSNILMNSNNVFVFGKDQKNFGFGKENNQINMSGTTPDVSHISENNSVPNRTDSSMSSSVGIGIQLNDSFCGVPPVNKDEKNSMRFTSKLAGLESSVADCSTPSTTFSFRNYNLFPGAGQKLENASNKSFRGKRLKKAEKLKQKTMVQELFGQDRSKESISLQTSPSCGSPMDYSPYKDTNSSNAPEAGNGNGGKGELDVNKKDTSKDPEKSGDDENNSSFSPSLPAQDGLSALRRQYKKKYKLKVGPNHTVQSNNAYKGSGNQDDVPTMAHEMCERWRLRGNQAYHDGELFNAEEFYSTGIDIAPHVSTPGYSMKPLLLCYGNRAATRMSLGRMREAIGDCCKAAELDPNFLKVTLRSGNCYLVLGEVEDAIQCYTKCLDLGIDVCLDRRITIEAAHCLQKANRVAEYMHQSTKLLQEGTDVSASSALRNIDEALSISRLSERLLQMKGEALCRLRMYDDVIQLCEQTLDISKKNFDTANVKLWRRHIQAKSQFHLGRLDLALDLIEKQEKMPTGSRSVDATQESAIALAATIRELLSLKKSGNEAFNSGRYAEAIENYTSAISKSFESRPFMAICFCNRAAAYQSINQIVDAIADCSLSIALDENYEKAISRRATLHEMIRDYKQAVCDLQRLISLLESRSQTKTQQTDCRSKSNGGSVRDLRKARRRLSSVEEKAKKEIPLDLYLILGVKASDAESEIKKAYRKAALRHHPDKVLVRSDVGDYGTLWKDFGEKIHNDADRLFKIIGEAYAVLSDSSKRSEYDNGEELRNIYKDSSRSGNSGRPSTSYSSPYERGNWYERRNWRYWNESRSYSSSSHSRW